MIVFNKKIQHIAYWPGILLLGGFLLACIFLRSSFLLPFINQIRGHEVTAVGLAKIGTYFLTLKIFMLFWGIAFCYLGYAERHPSFLAKSVRFLENIWQRLIKVGSGRMFWLIFALAFLLRLILALDFNDLNLSHDAAHYLGLAKSISNGEGFISHALWAIYLLPAKIPFPDLYRQPLWPYLLSFAGLFKVSFFWFGVFLNLVFGALIPAFSYLLGLKIANSKNLALVAGLVVFFNGALINHSMTLLVEPIYIILVLLIFIFLFRRGSLVNLIFIGVIWALAFLARREALAVLPLVILLALWLKDKKLVKTFGRFILILSVFFLCLSPWLWRTYKLAGSFFYSDVNYHVVPVFGADYSRDYLGSFRQLIPPETNVLKFIVNHPAISARHIAWQGWRFLKDLPLAIFFSFLAVIFLAAGFWRGRRLSRIYPLYFYLIISLLFFVGLSYATRYLLPLVPFFSFFIALAFFQFYLWLSRRSLKILLCPALLVVFLLPFCLGIKANLERNNFPQPKLVAYKKVAALIKGKVAQNEAVIISDDQIYQYQYFSGQNCLQFPDATISQLTDILKKYKVKYIVIFTGSPKGHWANLRKIADDGHPLLKENLFKDQYYYVYEVDFAPGA